MWRVVAVLGGALLLGVLLASGAAVWPLRPGVVGVLVMVAVALAVRRRWGLLAETAPGSPERLLWVSLATHAVIAAHLLTTLYRIGPSLVMHTPVTHALGVDSWTLVGGAFVAYWIVRDPQPRKDERDDAIAAAGTRAAYYGLLMMLGFQIPILGFVQHGWLSQLSRPSIAHALILAIILSVLIDSFTRLTAYARDADAAQQ